MSTQLTPVAATTTTPAPQPPEPVVALHEWHHRNIVRAFLAQQAKSYRIGVGVKLIVRLGALGAVHFLDVSKQATALVTMAVMIWLLVDAFRTPMTQATHKARLSFGVANKLGPFLAQRAKAHAQLEGAALEEALVADLRGGKPAPGGPA